MDLWLCGAIIVMDNVVDKFKIMITLKVLRMILLTSLSKNMKIIFVLVMLLLVKIAIGIILNIGLSHSIILTSDS